MAFVIMVLVIHNRRILFLGKVTGWEGVIDHVGLPILIVIYLNLTKLLVQSEDLQDCPLKGKNGDSEHSIPVCCLTDA